MPGPFVWHRHDNEDEQFLVIYGRLRIEFQDKDVWVDKGGFLIVPRGMQHRLVADGEAHIMLFEPADTLNTGM